MLFVIFAAILKAVIYTTKGTKFKKDFRSGFKTPSKAQWLRCRPPVNAHIPMYAALSRSACALPLNLIWDFETTSMAYFFVFFVIFVVIFCFGSGWPE
jgi:hypothetical protein